MPGDKTQNGHNLTALKEEIRADVDTLQSLKEQRKGINEDMSAIRSKLESKGIPKKALSMAMTYSNLDADDRQGFDVAYEIVREAIGLPVQEDFDRWAARQAAKSGESAGQTVN